MQKDIIIALDFADEAQTFHFLNLFHEEPLFIKVGMELFFKEGPNIIYQLKQKGYKIFLDLKLHDIPNTVKNAMKNIAKLEVDLVNVHAMGGIEMMKAAFDGLNSGNHKTPKCIAVTHLTASSESMLKKELLINSSTNEIVLHYAKNAYQAGLAGVVCSPLESTIIHDALGANFITVTPGIRLEKDDLNDQVRVTTPIMAKQLGANYIVVGRSITKAKNPVEIYQQIKRDFI